MGVFLFVFLVFKGQALKLSIIKAKRVLVDEAEGKVLHTVTTLHTLCSNERARLIYLGKWLVWTYMTYRGILQWFITNNDKKTQHLDAILSQIQAQRLNHEYKLFSWQHLLFWKNMLQYENSVWWNILKIFQDFTWPLGVAMKKMLTHKWLLKWHILYNRIQYIKFFSLSQSYTCNNWRRQTCYCI